METPLQQPHQNPEAVLHTGHFRIGERRQGAFDDSASVKYARLIGDDLPIPLEAFAGLDCHSATYEFFNYASCHREDNHDWRDFRVKFRRLSNDPQWWGGVLLVLSGIERLGIHGIGDLLGQPITWMSVESTWFLIGNGALMIACLPLARRIWPSR